MKMLTIFHVFLYIYTNSMPNAANQVQFIYILNNNKWLNNIPAGSHKRLMNFYSYRIEKIFT